MHQNIKSKIRLVMIEFKKGDSVYSPEYKNGTVVDIVEGDRNPIKIIFESGECEEFNGREVDCWLKIYHGKDLPVSVEECIPNRKQYKYLNILVDLSGYTVEVFNTLQDAREAACVVHYVAIGIKVEVKK